MFNNFFNITFKLIIIKAKLTKLKTFYFVFFRKIKIKKTVLAQKYKNLLLLTVFFD